MDYELTNILVWLGTYIAWGVWLFLPIMIAAALVKKNIPLLIRMLKYLLNSVVFLIAAAFIGELAMVVRPPILQTREASEESLRGLIKSHQVNDVYVALILVVMLLLINLLFYFKFEKRRNKKDITILAVISIVVSGFSIWLTGQYAYFGLMQEINRHFKS